jgi:phytoene/squalene synthetase
MKAASYFNPAPAITKAASRQTYYTIGLLVDRGRVLDAYQAYAYFRWVDDLLDGGSLSRIEREAFLARQRSVMAGCYAGLPQPDAGLEEQLLVDLIRKDPDPHSGLHAYIHNMMAVMDFDARRRDRLISHEELSTYSRLLATAVTEALHYFIGRRCASPRNEARYLAVTAAHITHMLRDTFDDVQAGYFNIPREFLHANGIEASDVTSRAYRTWVHSRVELARSYFKAGRYYMAQVRNPRCRLAGYAYVARFESVLTAIERDDYVLKPQYRETKTSAAVLKAGLAVFASGFNQYVPANTSAHSDGRLQLKALPEREP